MTRTQIILLGAGLVMIITLFSLPKVVVDNDETELEATADIHSPSEAVESGSLQAYKDSLQISLDNKEKSTIFADSLAEKYRKFQYFDSAALVYDQYAETFPESDSWKKAGDASFEAYTYAVDEAKRSRFGKAATDYYNRVLEIDPNDLDRKTRLGLVLVGSSNPMQGIATLREVLEADPSHRDALYNMGMLSIQSNQYSKAVERFERLKEYYPDDIQARFYLALCYLETGNKDGARKEFEFVKTREEDPEVIATVDSYLEDLN